MLAVEAGVQILGLPLAVCGSWANFPIPLNYKVVIGLPTWLSFIWKRLRHMCKCQTHRRILLFFFFLCKLENGMFSILQLFYLLRRGTGYSLEPRTQPSTCDRGTKGTEGKARDLRCRKFSGRVFKTLRVKFQGSRPRA